MPNPTRLSWRHPGDNTDGSPFTAEQFAGWTLEINGQAGVSVPAGFEQDGQYELPLADVAAFSESRAYTLRMAVTNRAGSTSEWSEPLTFSMDFRKPERPFGLSAS